MDAHSFQCPYCWERISMLIDNSIPYQSYIEDCEVCCNPIQITASISNGELEHFHAESIEQ